MVVCDGCFGFVADYADGVSVEDCGTECAVGFAAVDVVGLVSVASCLGLVVCAA